MTPKHILSSTSESVYLDTAAVSAAVKGDHPAQIPALAALIREHEAGKLHLVASTEVLGEIEKIPRRYQGPHLGFYNQLKHLPAAGVSWIDDVKAAPIRTMDSDYATLRGILPDEPDRRHVLHAVRNGVSEFVTVDWHTILKYAPKLEAAFPRVRFGTPMEVVKRRGILTT